jgi:nitric oxide reductase subunit C
MREVMTKSMARNIFYGGSLFFILIFVGLTAQSHLHITTTSTDATTLTESVAAGKHLWEIHSCVNCHTILGEGAYFAPEVGNVMTRWGIEPGDNVGAFEMLKAWMDSMPSGVEGRRQMPNFGLTDEEYRNLADFLLWTDSIDAQGWPPNDAG